MFMSELAELLKGHSLNPEVALLVIEIFPCNEPWRSV